jgi:hypothetical protein
MQVYGVPDTLNDEIMSYSVLKSGIGCPRTGMMPDSLVGTTTTQLKEYLTRYICTDTNHMRW